MSALLDDTPLYPVPVPARRPALRLVVSDPLPERPLGPAAGAPVRRTFAQGPRALDVPRPARLTRRGMLVLSLAVALLAGGLLLLARLSAPAGAGSEPAVARTSSTSVTVASGDTLWSIAGRVAPNRDPRQEVTVLQRLNGLGDSATLVPGQVLRVR